MMPAVTCFPVASISRSASLHDQFQHGQTPGSQGPCPFGVANRFRIEFEPLSSYPRLFDFRFFIEQVTISDHQVSQHSPLDGSGLSQQYRRVAGIHVRIQDSSSVGWGSSSPSPQSRPPVQSADGIRQKIDELDSAKPSGIKRVPDSETLGILFETLTVGGEFIPKDYPGILVRLPDGTMIGYRDSVKTDRDSIDTFYPGGKSGKVIVDPAKDD